MGQTLAKNIDLLLVQKKKNLQFDNWCVKRAEVTMFAIMTRCFQEEQRLQKYWPGRLDRKITSHRRSIRNVCLAGDEIRRALCENGQLIKYQYIIPERGVQPWERGGHVYIHVYLFRVSVRVVCPVVSISQCLYLAFFHSCPSPPAVYSSSRHLSVYPKLQTNLIQC